MKTPTNPTPQTLHELRERVQALKRNGESFSDIDWNDSIDEIITIFESMEEVNERK